MTKRISLVETAHVIIRESMGEGAFAIDATLGNGHDTLFLAQCVGESGRVFGFDIQPEALQATERRLRQHGVDERVMLFLASHAEMELHIPRDLHGRIQAVMFNLGYLPGADKGIITRVGSTLPALDSTCRLLAEKGVMTVMAYPGHSGGDEEADGVGQWLEHLDCLRYQVQNIVSRHDQVNAPRLFVIRKAA